MLQRPLWEALAQDEGETLARDGVSAEPDACTEHLVRDYQKQRRHGSSMLVER